MTRRGKRGFLLLATFSLLGVAVIGHYHMSPSAMLRLAHLTQPKNIYADGGYYPICVSVRARSGDHLKLAFQSRVGRGHFPQKIITLKSRGLDRVCTTLIGPKLPAAGKSGRIRVLALNESAKLRGRLTSRPFPIRPAPPRP